MTLIPILILLIYLILCTYTDIKTSTISLMLSAIVACLLIICNILICHSSLLQLIISLIPGIFLLIISLVSHGALGIGDGVIILIVGLGMNFSSCTFVLFLSLFLSTIFSFIIFIKKRNLKSSFPLAPFILCGYTLTLLINL
ncbi:MAG: hypothetical protein GX225_06220 [Clostridiales bacterium]|nr:hypothetical protein [Clostridiales bacterium]